MAKNSTLTLDEAIERAPSIIGRPNKKTRSTGYQYVPTIKPLEMLVAAYGYKITQAEETRTLKQEKKGRQKHLIRLRHDKDQDESGANEVILLNSHDGSSSYVILSGRFRFICSNGMISGDIDSRRTVRHVGRDVLRQGGGFSARHCQWL